MYLRSYPNCRRLLFRGAAGHARSFLFYGTCPEFVLVQAKDKNKHEKDIIVQYVACGHLLLTGFF